MKHSTTKFSSSIYLISFIAILLFEIGCRKENLDPKASAFSLQQALDQARGALKTAPEHNFFDFDFAETNNPHVVQAADDRNNEHLLDSLAYVLIQQNQANKFVGNLVADVGYPFWTRSIIFTTPPDSAQVVLLPLAHLGADSVEAFIIGKLSLATGWSIQIHLRSDVDSLIEIQSLDTDGLGFKVVSFYLLDIRVFGEPSIKQMSWIAQLLDDNLVSKAEDRCGAVTWCGHLTLTDLKNNKAEDRSLECFTILWECPQYNNWYDPWVGDVGGGPGLTPPPGEGNPTGGSNGGQSGGFGNGGGNSLPIITDEGFYASDVYSAVFDWHAQGLITAEETYSFLAIHQTFNLTVSQAYWLLLGPGQGDIAQGLGNYANTHGTFELAPEAAHLLLNYLIDNNITNIQGQSFDGYGPEYAGCPTCFQWAVSMEYAILMAQNPCPTNDEWCAWSRMLEATWNVLMDDLHTALDIAGLVPGYGEVFDLANATLYAVQGDGTNATISALAMVPVAGWTATGAKYARKIQNLAGNNMTLKFLYKQTDDLVIFGGASSENAARRQLRNILKTPSGFQAHHIIPWELRNHPVVQAAARVPDDDAFHLNELLNGISLPTAAGGNLPKHLGSHPDYDLRVRASLNAIETDLGNNMSPVDAARELRKLIQRINTQIKSTQGGTINDVSGW